MANKIGLQTEIALQQREIVTQTAPAKRLSISVVIVNALLKRVMRQGLVRAKAAPDKRWPYYLRLEGIEEKSRLAACYLNSFFSFFRMVRQAYRPHFQS